MKLLPANTLENFVRKERIDQGYKTTKSFADVLGCSCSVLMNIELGYTHPINRSGTVHSVVTKICKELNIEFTDLFPREICALKSNELLPSQKANILGQDQKENQESDIINKQVWEFLEKCLNDFPKRYTKIMKLRYKLGMTRAEVANLFNISPSRITEIEKYSLRILRHPGRIRSFNGTTPGTLEELKKIEEKEIREREITKNKNFIKNWQNHVEEMHGHVLYGTRDGYVIDSTKEPVTCMFCGLYKNELIGVSCKKEIKG